MTSSKMLSPRKGELASWIEQFERDMYYIYICAAKILEWSKNVKICANDIIHKQVHGKAVL